MNAPEPKPCKHPQHFRETSLKWSDMARKRVQVLQRCGKCHARRWGKIVWAEWKTL